MGLAYQCDELTCRKFLIAGQDLVFKVTKKDDDKTQYMCLDCIVLSRNNKAKEGSRHWFDPYKIDLVTGRERCND